MKGHTPLLLKPATTDEVSRILALCNETGTPVVPQGGNTGLVGGQIPLGGEILLSLSRMNRVRHVDSAGANMIVEAGVTLAAAQAAADGVGLYFPLSIASEGSATIGGNLSTNAGGVHVLRYGMARELVLGLEVVLADGRVLDMLRTLRKDNTGYDLKNLFIGAEGTLGIITAAALKLFPRPTEYATAFIAVPDPKSAVDLLTYLQSETGSLLSAYELIARSGLNLVLAHIPGTSDPLNAVSPWYVLAEATSGAARFGLKHVLENALGVAMEKGVATDAVIASSEAQRTAIWRLRESMSEAQKKRRRLAQARYRRSGCRHSRFRRARDSGRAQDRARRAAGAVRPSRRRQSPFQFQRSRGRRRSGLPREARRNRARRARHRARLRRFDQRRARHRRNEARGTFAL